MGPESWAFAMAGSGDWKPYDSRNHFARHSSGLFCSLETSHRGKGLATETEQAQFYVRKDEWGQHVESPNHSNEWETSVHPS